MAPIDIHRILRRVRAGDLGEAIDLARASGFFPPYVVVTFAFPNRKS
jgi:hypothetical protein